MLKFEQLIYYWNLKGVKEGEDLFNDSVHLSDTSLLNILGISAVLQYNNFCFCFDSGSTSR